MYDEKNENYDDDYNNDNDSNDIFLRYRLFESIREKCVTFFDE